MREAIGGTYMLQLMAFFMVIYIAFMSAMLLYTQVYKAKNATIEYIERAPSGSTISSCDLATYMVDHGMSKAGRYSITKHESSIGKNYYTVGLLLEVSFLPSISAFSIRIPIIGETKLIPNDVDVFDTDGTYVLVSSSC